MRKTTTKPYPSGDEQARISALHRYKILNTPAESEFDNLAVMATESFKLPICIISFAGEDEVFYKANVGFKGRDFEPLKGSFGGQIIQPGEVFVLRDIPEHKDFFYNLNDVRFFAAAPLVSANGCSIGNFMVMGNVSTEFDAHKQLMLQHFAKMAMDLLEYRLALWEANALKELNQSLMTSNESLLAQNEWVSGYQEQVVQANAVLEGVLESYELLFKYSPIAIGICSCQDKIIWQANDALAEIFGKGRVLPGANLESLFGRINGKSICSVFDEIHPDTPSFLLKGAKLQIKATDGNKNIYVDLALQFVGRMGDESQNIMFILSDVTEQVILGQINNEANLVLMSAIEDTGMGYTIVEFENGEMSCNVQFKNNYGYSAHEGLNYPDIFKAMLPEYRQVIKNAVNEAIESKGIYRAEYEVKWRDGSIHRIRAYGKPMYDADGKATHIIGLNKIVH